MRSRKFIYILFSIFFPVISFAQAKDELTQSRILILLDGSSSMIHKWADGKEKFKAAGELIMKLMDSAYTVNDQVEFSLRVFGHQHTMEEDYCYDTKNEVPFAKDNKLQMSLRLAAIQPLGVTPIAYALQQAAEYDLTDEAHNAYSIILITDGGESCGGDICEVMRTLIRNKVFFRPYILSLENDPQLKNTYACMGDYLQVTKKEDMAKAVGVIVDAFRPVLKITPSEYKQLQSDVVKNEPKDLDTISGKTIKTWKDTVITEPLPVRAPAAKIDALALAPLYFFPVKYNKDDFKTFSRPTLLPPIVSELPLPVNITKIPVSRLAPVAANNTVADILLPAIGLPILPPVTKELLPLKIAPLPLVKAGTFLIMPNTDITINILPEASLPAITIQAPPIAPVRIDALLPTHQTLFAIAPIPDLKINNAAPDIGLPSIVTVTPPQPINKMTPLTSLHVKSFDITRPSPPKADRVSVVSLPPVVEEVQPQTVDKLPAITTAHQKTIGQNIPAPIKVNPTQADISLPPIKSEQPVAPVFTFSKIRLAPPMKFTLLIVIEEKNFQFRALPALPPLRKEEVAAVTNKKTAPGPKLNIPPVPPEKKAETRTETEDATETTLEVYFTNGKGKFYQSTPQVVLIDPATNKDIKSFYRTTDADGNPDPQKDIPAGTFNLTFSTKRSLIAPNVTIEKNKKNKVFITVKNTSLSFVYANAPGRPVKEFTAIVKERNKAQGRVQVQKCTEKIEYEPENYHIEINTFPTDVRNIDLEFDLEKAITIPQPGFIKFTNEIKVGSVTLYERAGDRYLPFSSWDLNDPRSDHLQIQPGEYQVHYQKGPVKSFAAEQVIPFNIRSTEVTEVILK